MERACVYIRAQIGCEYFHPINGALAAKYERMPCVAFQGDAGSSSMALNVSGGGSFFVVANSVMWSVKNVLEKREKNRAFYLYFSCEKNHFLELVSLVFFLYYIF